MNACGFERPAVTLQGGGFAFVGWSTLVRGLGSAGRNHRLGCRIHDAKGAKCPQESPQKQIGSKA